MSVPLKIAIPAIIVILVVLVFLFYFYYVKTEKYSDISVSKKNKILVSLFYSETCPACKMMKPKWDKMKKNKKFNFREIEINSNPLLTAKYNIQAVPTIMSYVVEDVDRENANDKFIYQHPLGKEFNEEVFLTNVSLLSA